MAPRASRRYRFAIVLDHYEVASADELFQLIRRKPQENPCDPPKRLLLVSRKIRQMALRKTIDEHRKPVLAVDDDRPEAAGSSGTFAGNPLLEDAASEIGVDKPLLCTPNCLEQSSITNSFAPSEPANHAFLTIFKARVAPVV